MGIAVSAVAATNADASVTINITQAGSDVALSASGTFDRASATMLGSVVSFGQQVSASDGFVAFGTQGAISAFGVTGPLSFGNATIFATVTSNTGPAIGIFGAFPDFFISSAYESNALIASSGIITNSTLASLGLVSGAYNFAAGGNAVTVNIGQATSGVPEPAIWGMMVLGFGLIGGAMRRRQLASALPDISV